MLLKVVIMSATLEAEAYSRFFLDCKIVKVPGRMYPVEVRRPLIATINDFLFAGSIHPGTSARLS